MSEGFTVDFQFNKAAVKARVDRANAKGIFIVTNEALKDANYYARKDTGNMIEESIIASQPEKGELVWPTPYAKKVYYTGTPSIDSNEHASLMWAHRGYAENREKYNQIIQKAAMSEV